MKSKFIFFVKLFLLVILCNWIMLYFIDVIRKPINFYVIGIVVFFLFFIIEIFLPRLIPIPIEIWEDYAVRLLLCFATFYNILHWKEIVNSPPKGFLPFVYDFFNLFKG